MTDKEKIEEAHGLWELAIVRLAVFVEARAEPSQFIEASKAEREAFKHWQEVSRSVLELS